jgi:methylated-DNA-protein-cysteine methyltransferase-like protein
VSGPGLYERIYEVVRAVPPGRVATYGQIARLAGRCGARQVGYALAALPEDSDVPWQRVINSEGRISLRRSGHEDLQRWLLEDEGVEFSLQGVVDLARFGWKPGSEGVEGTPDLFTGETAAAAPPPPPARPPRAAARAGGTPARDPRRPTQNRRARKGRR